MRSAAARATMRRMKRRALGVRIAVWLPFAAVASFGCDDEPKNLNKKPDASAAATAAPTPPAPKPPKILIEPGTFAIDAERVSPTDPDPVGQIATLVTGKPQVEGAIVEIEVKRAAKPSQMVTMMAALKKAKAKGVIAKTENRDKVVMPFTLTFAAPPQPDCAVVAYIAKDSKINVWTLGGGAAKTYSKGFAGPDMTLGTEGVRESVARCDAPILFVGADDAMNWGLVYDLATISKSGQDGGVGLAKITQFAIVANTVVPGRKVVLDP